MHFFAGKRACENDEDFGKLRQREQILLINAVFCVKGKNRKKDA